MRVHCPPPKATSGGRQRALASDQMAFPPHRHAGDCRGGRRRVALLARHAELFGDREAARPHGGCPSLARRLRRAPHLRRQQGRRRPGARLPARQRAAVPDGGEPAGRPGARRGDVWPRPPQGRQVHPHPRSLPRGGGELRRLVARGAKAPSGLRRRRQHVPRYAQGRPAARVPARRRNASAVEAGRTRSSG